jgi:hypothetical protein
MVKGVKKVKVDFCKKISCFTFRRKLVSAKKIVPNKKGDVGMWVGSEVLCVTNKATTKENCNNMDFGCDPTHIPTSFFLHS